MRNSEIRLPALEIQQGATRRLYSFAVDGKRLPEFASVSRVRRGDANEMLGYQRPEVLSHIKEIRGYIESDSPMIPNALVIAFDDRVRFVPGPQSTNQAFSRHGEIVIPLLTDETDEPKPGWIVDGQQRAAAIRDADIGSFPICVTAFITGDEQAQREQFILVNSTKPLPRSLIYELLPTTHARLPSLLQKRRFPAYLLDKLNSDDSSPFFKKIQTPTTPNGTIKDNSVLRMIENSISDGVLYRFRDAKNGEGDEERILDVLLRFWSAVRLVWPKEWDLAPRKSRLTHGAGIVSLGFVMDAISDRYRQAGVPTIEQYMADLLLIRDSCRWSEGFWKFGPGAERKWNEIQNTSKDIQLLTNYLLVVYRASVSRAESRGETRRGVRARAESA